MLHGEEMREIDELQDWGVGNAESWDEINCKQKMMRLYGETPGGGGGAKDIATISLFS